MEGEEQKAAKHFRKKASPLVDVRNMEIVHALPFSDLLAPRKTPHQSFHFTIVVSTFSFFILIMNLDLRSYVWFFREEAKKEILNSRYILFFWFDLHCSFLFFQQLDGVFYFVCLNLDSMESTRYQELRSSFSRKPNKIVLFIYLFGAEFACLVDE